MNWAHTFFLIFFLPASAFCQTNPNCQGMAVGLAKRLEGSWTEFVKTENGENLLGNLKVEFELGGCVLRQSFYSPDSSFSFSSFGHIDPASKMWHETFVLSNGRVAKYLWSMDDDDILINRITEDPTNLRRLRITNQSKNRYDVIDERSEDGGKTWNELELVITKRIE